MTTPASDMTSCPMCSHVVAEDDLQRHLRSHGLRLFWWLWKDDPNGAALVAVMAVTVTLAYVAGLMAIFEGSFR